MTIEGTFQGLRRNVFENSLFSTCLCLCSPSTPSSKEWWSMALYPLASQASRKGLWMVRWNNRNAFHDFQAFHSPSCLRTFNAPVPFGRHLVRFRNTAENACTWVDPKNQAFDPMTSFCRSRIFGIVREFNSNRAFAQCIKPLVEKTPNEDQ